MAIKIQSIIEAVEDNGIKCLVHGLAGSGKTVLCGTAGKPTIIISAEGGLLSLKGAIEKGLLPKSVLKLVKIIEVNSMDDFQEAYDLFEESDEQLCEWICLDSVSEIAEQILSNAKKESKDPRQAYGVLIEDMINLMKGFRDLKGYNVLMTCKQQRITDDDDGRAMYKPLLPGKRLHQEVPYLFDEVFALRVEQDEDGNDVRYLQTNRDTKYEAKDRSGHLEMFEEPSLHSLVKKMREGAENGEIDYSEIRAAQVAEELEKAEEEEASVDEADVPEREEPETEAEEEENTATEDEEESDPEEAVEKTAEEETEVISSKDQYWYHEPSDSVLSSEEGDDISELLGNPDVEEISKLKFTKLESRDS